MMITDKELKRRFVMAVDEVLPPAPALETLVRDDLRLEQRPARRAMSAGSIVRPRAGLRLAAGVALIVVAITLMTALLFGARPLGLIAPARQPTPLASPLSGYKFTPTATTRLASWPAGGAVPVELAGCWRSLKHANDAAFEVCLGSYSFDVGQGYTVGNVVVKRF